MTTPVSVFADHAATEFAVYQAELAVPGKLLGGLPGDPDTVKGWLTGTAGKALGQSKEEIMMRNLLTYVSRCGYETADLQELVASGASLDDVFQAATVLMGESKITRFARNGTVCLEARNVQAAIKESANIAFPPADKWFDKVTGEPTGRKNPTAAKGLKSLIAEWVTVEPGLISTGVTEPTIEQIVKHTPNGASLGLHEAVENVTLSFTVNVFRDLVPQNVWASIWTVGEKIGLGACRSMGFGRYIVTRWEKTSRRKK